MTVEGVVWYWAVGEAQGSAARGAVCAAWVIRCGRVVAAAPLTLTECWRVALLVRGWKRARCVTLAPLAWPGCPFAALAGGCAWFEGGDCPAGINNPGDRARFEGLCARGVKTAARGESDPTLNDDWNAPSAMAAEPRADLPGLCGTWAGETSRAWRGESRCPGSDMRWCAFVPLWRRCSATRWVSTPGECMRGLRA